MGIREILLEALAGDVMAGGGGAAGPDVRHQPAGDVQGMMATFFYFSEFFRLSPKT